MALTVEKLNDDTTFLLAFAPPFTPRKAGRKFPGAFTILIDPWLAGRSSILHPAFQVSHHTSDCVLKSLADLQEQPDLVIISQDKPDHCHKETLCTLPSDTSTRILATPAAAKKIWSWKHFDSSIVHVMKPYNAQKPETVIKISVPAYTSSSSKGQITIANVPTRRDMTGLHNAIGITYRPPGSMLTAFEGELIKLTDMMNPSSTSPMLHKACSAIKLTEPASSPPPALPNRPRTTSSPRPVFLDPLGRAQRLPEHPALRTTNGRDRADSKLDRPETRAHKEKTLSVLYTPHGVSYTTLSSYIDRHLRPTAAGAPLTALFHSINTEENPWFMGGIVANGAPGGTVIARQLRAKHWISAHDELKDNRGMATTWIKSKQYTVGEVEQMLKEGQIWKDADTQVHALGVGESMRIDG
ncbi:hypothetical protein LTR85_010573 [Meristemomyces frigidus]|nr:hypothetical protein LTR85_010573 [Meristemomyces frigidus]